MLCFAAETDRIAVNSHGIEMHREATEECAWKGKVRNCMATSRISVNPLRKVVEWNR